MKLKGQYTAVGYWGRNPWKRVETEQLPGRARVLLQDKLITRGRRASLWLPVKETDAIAVPCTCAKATTDASQRRCLTCYGSKVGPGYFKFLHTTLFWCSADLTHLTLANTAIQTVFKPNPVMLIAGQTSGTIITSDQAYLNPKLANWTIALNAFLRTPTNAVTLDYSINAGVSWTAVSITHSTIQPGLFTGTILGSALGTSGNLRLRVTMTRASASDDSPAFEIVRVRRPNVEKQNSMLANLRRDMQPGEILIDRTWVQETASLVAALGLDFNHAGDNAWTVPLDYFDTTLTRDTPICRVDDLASGLHPFYEFGDGVQALTRYELTKIDFDTNLGMFCFQNFSDQRVQAGQPINLVF